MICSSFSWPNMFDVARSTANLYTDVRSITNRVKLLLLTDPTELHMNPNFGVGLRKYMFQYNGQENTIAMIRDDLIEQLRLWEPAVIPEETTVTQSRSYTDESGLLDTSVANLNHLKLTITLTTAYSEIISLEVSQNDISRVNRAAELI